MLVSLCIFQFLETSLFTFLSTSFQYNLILDSSNTHLKPLTTSTKPQTSARAHLKTDLAIYFEKLEHQNLLSTTSQLSGLVKKAM